MKKIENHIVILKNDAVGDLVHSLPAIYSIINNNDITKITLFISKQSKGFNFFFDNKKINIEILNNNLTIVEKIKLFFFFLFRKIDKTFILAPKQFYFYLPVLFRKIKFYAICVNNINKYKRPKEFLRKYLFKYKINHRDAIFKRKPTADLQFSLCSEDIEKKKNFNFNPHISANLKEKLPDKYIYFHLKKKIADDLGWEIKELNILFNKFTEFYPNVILTKDIEIDKNNAIFKNNFNSYDLKTSKFIDNNSKVLFLDNIEGKDLYNVIKLSEKVVAFHGMMTNLGSLEYKPVIDLFYCKINSWNDYRNYRNSFYEFKPKYKGYNFIIPSKDINKTLKKILFLLK